MKTNCKYGVSVAALVLADVVEEHVDSNKIGRKVARLLNHYNVRAEYIESGVLAYYLCGDISTKVEHVVSAGILYNLLVKDYLQRCDTVFYHKADTQVRSFTKNVIKARYKAWLDTYRCNKQISIT